MASRSVDGAVVTHGLYTQASRPRRDEMRFIAHLASLPFVLSERFFKSALTSWYLR